MKKDQTNIIQFPKPSSPAPGLQPAASFERRRKKRRWNPSLATTICSLIAITLATGTSNISFFTKLEGSAEMASMNSLRGVASIESLSEPRDAAWEKSVAESLASADVRDVASISVGHEASL